MGSATLRRAGDPRYGGALSASRCRNTYDGIFARTPISAGRRRLPTPYLPTDRHSTVGSCPAWHASSAKSTQLLERYEPTLAVRAVMQFVDDDVSKLVRATVPRPLLRCRAGGQPSGIRDSSRSSDSHGAASRALSCHSSGLAASTARRHLGAFGGIRSCREAAQPWTIHWNRPWLISGAWPLWADRAREEAKIKTRQPLSRLVCVVPRGSERPGRGSVRMGIPTGALTGGPIGIARTLTRCSERSSMSRGRVARVRRLVGTPYRQG